MKVIKKGKLIILFLIVLCLTGCGKYEGDLKINKNKSANLTLFVGVDQSYLNDKEYVNKKDIDRLKKKGFKISEYEKDNYKGYKLIYKIKNIDSLSTKENVRINLLEIFDENFNFKLFKVEKSFLKNKYTAKFKLDAADTRLNDLRNGGELFATEPVMSPSSGSEDNLEESIQSEKGASSNKDEDEDIKNGNANSAVNRAPSKGEVERQSFIPNTSRVLRLTRRGSDPGIDDIYSSSPIDLKFNVELPYSALKNNATYSKEDDKKLEWITVEAGAQYINFEFELYNYRTMILTAILVLLIILFFIKFSINKKNIRKQIEKEIRKQRKKGNLSYKNTSDIDVSYGEVLNVMFGGLIKIIKGIANKVIEIYKNLFSNSYINEEEVLRKIETDSKIRKPNNKNTNRNKNQNKNKNYKNNKSRNNNQYKNNKTKKNSKNNQNIKKNNKKSGKFDEYFDDEII